MVQVVCAGLVRPWNSKPRRHVTTSLQRHFRFDHLNSCAPACTHTGSQRQRTWNPSPINMHAHLLICLPTCPQVTNQPHLLDTVASCCLCPSRFLGFRAPASKQASKQAGGATSSPPSRRHSATRWRHECGPQTVQRGCGAASPEAQHQQPGVAVLSTPHAPCPTCWRGPCHRLPVILLGVPPQLPRLSVVLLLVLTGMPRCGRPPQLTAQCGSRERSGCPGARGTGRAAHTHTHMQLQHTGQGFQV